MGYEHMDKDNVVYASSPEAYEYLFRIYKKIRFLVAYVSHKKSTNEQIRSEFISLLVHKFQNPNFRIKEVAFPFTPRVDSQSCVVEKKEIILNIKDFDGSRSSFSNENDVMYVCIHLLTLLATKPRHGRNKVFWSNFRYLLKNAIRLGIYKYVDYSIHNAFVDGKVLRSTILLPNDDYDKRDEILIDKLVYHFPARRIQRAWDKCLSDPTNPIGRKHILREFTEMEENNGVPVNSRYSYYKSIQNEIRPNKPINMI